MKKLKITAIVLSGILFLIIISVLIKNITSGTGEQIETKNIQSEKNINGQVETKQVSLSDEAPEIKNNTGNWINTDKELTLNDLKGKVVLIEFWTFGCYNCRNTLPYLNTWYEKYKSDSFEMIGIHCPEFDNERNFENVKESVAELGIKYPVLTDNEFSIWEKYNVRAWPTIFLIDKNGAIRYSRIGEGNYDKTERMLNELLNENHSREKNN
jgi:thiol-disulfide isomerase/thioredoxin